MYMHKNSVQFIMLVRPSPISISSISTMLWRFRIDNWLPIHFYMYVRCGYRQCCDDILSISTVDLLYTSTCTYVSISTMLWRYRVDIDNWFPIHFFRYTECWYRQYCDDIDILPMYVRVDIYNVVTISCRYRHLNSHTLLHVSIVIAANLQNCLKKQTKIYMC
jgi:hypothetical protein